MSVIAFPADRTGDTPTFRRARRAGHPSASAPYDQGDQGDHERTLLLFVTPIEANMIRTALATSSATAARDLAAWIDALISSRSSDDCNPHGMPRPS